MRTWISSLVLVIAVETSLGQFPSDVNITMSDGVVLEATIVRPVTSLPPWPGLVLVHGYGGNKSHMLELSLGLAAYGYASIAYSVRGQGNSGGLSTVSGSREAQDLLEVIQYFRNALGIDPNRLGVTGASQGGIHAWMAAVHRMPGVRAVVPLLATPDFARALVPNGCVTYGLPREITLNSVRYSTDRDRARNFIIADQHDSLLLFIDERDLGRFVDSIRIPVFQGLGWADFLFPVNGGIAARENLASRRIPIWSYFGTNGHGEAVDTMHAAFVLEKTIYWFDHWLKGYSLDGDSIAMVFYADDRPGWPMHTTPVWPPEPHSMYRFYITPSGLSATPPIDPASFPFSLSYDSTYTPQMAWDDLYGGQQFMSAFTSTSVRLMSPPLGTDLEVTGTPGGNIFVQSDAQKFQVHVRYYDVVDTGTGYEWKFMSRSINGIRQNSSGQIHEIQLEARALSHIIPAGQRIGIEVTSFDLLHADRANTIPYFVSSNSILHTSPSQASYVEIPVVGVISHVMPVAGIPTDFMLYQNYPNPFNPSTNIQFTLPARTPERVGQAGFTSLKVYDILGREVATLLNEEMIPGTYEVTWDATGFASGVYFYRLNAGEFVQTRKLILQK